MTCCEEIVAGDLVEREAGVFTNVGGTVVEDRRATLPEDADFAAGPEVECVAAASDRTCSPLPVPLPPPEDATVEGPRVPSEVVAGVAF